MDYSTAYVRFRNSPVKNTFADRVWDLIPIIEVLSPVRYWLLKRRGACRHKMKRHTTPLYNSKGQAMEKVLKFGGVLRSSEMPQPVCIKCWRRLTVGNRRKYWTDSESKRLIIISGVSRSFGCSRIAPLCPSIRRSLISSLGRT